MSRPAKPTKQQINEMFSVFVSKKLMLRLVNSGQSNLSDVQDSLVKELFDCAYFILVNVTRLGDADLFKRVYNMSKDIVPSKAMKSVMKHPEMYDNMLMAKQRFLADTAELMAQITGISGNNAHVR